MALFRRKIWLEILAAAAFLLAIAGGILAYLYWKANQDLREAIAEADRLDPGWQLADLEEKRDVIPNEENGALQVLAAAKLLPANWPSQQRFSKADADKADDDNLSIEDSILHLSPELQLNDEQLQYLKAEVKSASQALEKARKLLHMPRGRYEVEWSLDMINAKLPSQHCRAIAKLLYFESVLQAHDQKADEALSAAQGVLNAGRSIGDEPIIISQIVRRGCRLLALRDMERVLAQGQASEIALERAQSCLHDEADQPMLLIGARGERAGIFRKLEAIRTGGLRFSQLTGKGPKSKWEEWSEDVGGSMFMRAFQTPFLRFQTKCVELAKLPAEEQISGLQKLKEQQTNLPILVALWVPAYEKFVQGVVRDQAFLRCAYVAIAVERYRRAHNHWPDSLDALVPEFLRELPVDPHSGSPLNYRRLDDGVVIYSVGPDGQDNSGKLDRWDPTAAGTDIGFQLWDVPQRRQPWRPPKKAEAAENQRDQNDTDE